MDLPYRIAPSIPPATKSSIWLDTFCTTVTLGLSCKNLGKISKGDGFSAKSYQHADFLGLMNPLIMVDHFVMSEPTFGTHSYVRLSAVTVLFKDSEGAFHNRDPLGNDIDLALGDL